MLRFSYRKGLRMGVVKSLNERDIFYFYPIVKNFFRIGEVL